MPLSTPILLLLLAPFLSLPPQEGEDVSKAFEALRSEVDVPGVVGLVLQEGEVIAFGVAGVRVAGADEPLELGDPIHLGSCAKAMTATLAATLVEQGVLGWETTIAEALPELSEKIDPGYRAVTLLELLRHRGGIAERRRDDLEFLFPRMQAMQGSAREVRDQVIALALESPPVAPPANGFDYSNYGYMTAGAMLERRTGKSWDELMRAELFAPLGLKSAGIGSPPGEHVPVGHLRENGAWTPLPPGPAGFLPDAMGPAGLVHCSLTDWARFVAQHLAGHRGDAGFLKASTYATLHADPAGGGYASGWGLARHVWSWGEGEVLTHSGSDNTWFSIVFAMPAWDLVVVTATNAAGTPGQSACERARDLLLETAGFRD